MIDWCAAREVIDQEELAQLRIAEMERARRNFRPETKEQTGRWGENNRGILVGFSDLRFGENGG